MARDVVLVTIDALRADHVGFTDVAPPADPESAGDEPGRVPATPTLDGFADEALVCDRAFAGGPYTRGSFPSLLTGCHSWGPCPNPMAERPHVAVAFREAGYTTCGVHSNPHLADGTGYERGFETFHDGMDAGGVLSTAREGVEKLLGTYEPYETAERTTERAAAWLDRSAGPRFLWVHYMDVHAPYRPRRGTESESVSNRASQRLWDAMKTNDADRFSPGELATLRRLYRGEVEHLDRELRSLFDAVDRACDDPVVLVVSDHGDLFGEDDYVGHPGHLHDALVHVPFAVGGLERTDRLSTAVSAVDVLPTLCDAADVTVPEMVEGRPVAELAEPAEPAELAEPAEPTEPAESAEPAEPAEPTGGAAETSERGARVVFSQSGSPGQNLALLATDGDRSLVRGIDVDESWLFDRASGERRPASAAPPELSAALDDHLRGIDEADDRPTGAVSDEVARRLSDLGYT